MFGEIGARNILDFGKGCQKKDQTLERRVSESSVPMLCNRPILFDLPGHQTRKPSYSNTICSMFQGYQASILSYSNTIQSSGAPDKVAHSLHYYLLRVLDSGWVAVKIV